ncbi:placenta growth factor [Sarcoptes scabiei]|uniref:Uncharacterized protein n=1 Tax=Sarcoptes scabiei TaxID=52283 RepID=A0A132AG14_SARSC|nr:hypothetical protein QR98_0084920 [Sarcoptes scabiei]UXI18255.1 placenta growth factor [Sarcoptes scabiei]
MNFFHCLLLLIAGGLIEAYVVDQKAQNDCRQIHHCDVDTNGTHYSENGCHLTCCLHGHEYHHAMNENQICLVGNGAWHCKKGHCIPTENLGYIDVEIISAALSRPANAYATVCLQNNTDPVPLPIRDRSKCIQCSTQVKPHTARPVWHQICRGSGKYIFRKNSRVTFEVWDYHGSQIPNVFLGGSTLTIKKLLEFGDSGRAINMALFGSPFRGQLTGRITWTPLKK